MSKSIRIKTNPGGDDNYVSINLTQDFDQLKVLSLSIDQEDVYRSFESNYGVVAGRIDINNGFGLKNAKVSIFIPLDDIDKQNDVKKEIYPYESITTRNSNGVRYNLLPNRQQNENHTPTGTFPSKRQILDNSTMIEIYDKYYKFTTTTNEAGDYMFFGVPVGEQQVFIDIDVSDIGFLSVRPYDLISKGKSEEEFVDRFTFSDSNDLDKLPQIINTNSVVNVLPFWADDLEEGRKVGITRFDYSVTEYELTPTAMFMGSIFSDNENDSLSKNCRPRKKMGQMNELVTGEGVIEAITRTSGGDIVKSKDIPTDPIDENGNWAIELPMNIRKVITDENGALIPSPDGKTGIATEADYRFRISMGSDNSIGRKRTRAKMLVPNMTNNYKFGEYGGDELITAQKAGEPIFKINEQLSYFNEEIPADTDPTIQYNYLEDFYTFRWKKIYTVRQYIPRYQPNGNESPSQKNYIGFKQILDGNGVNKLPYNRLFTKVNPLYSILCFLLTLFGLISAFVNSIIQVINNIFSQVCEIKIPFPCFTFQFKRQGGQSIKRKYQQSKRQNNNKGWAGDGNLKSEKDADDIKDSCRNENDWVGELKTNDDGSESFCWTINSDRPSETELENCATFADAPSVTQEGNMLPEGTWYKGGPYWYNSQACANQHGLSNSSTSWGAGCKRILVKQKSDTESGGYTFADSKNCDNKEKCEEIPDGAIGIKFKILTLCVRIFYIFRDICPIKGLCNNCSNDNDTANGIIGKVNKNCCNGCDECDELGKCSEETEGEENCKKECQKNCLQGCCEKVAPIKLICSEEGAPIKPVLFTSGECVGDLVTRCKSCQGAYFSPISDWVACQLEGIATFLGMIDFDFYNDWMNGSLYFPLIKRKVKIKRGRKGKRGQGQLKKDVFCDYDCDGTEPDYQTPDELSLWSIRIRGGGKMSYEFDNGLETCKVNIPKRVSAREWYDTQEKARKSISFEGFRKGDETIPCSFTLDDWCQKDGNVCDDESPFAGNENKKIILKGKTVDGPHGKPKYLKTGVDSDGDGITDATVWKNFGGHGHHKNKCKENFLIERLEYTKNNYSDCQSVNKEADPDDESIVESEQSDTVEPSVTEFVDVSTYNTNETKTLTHDLDTFNTKVFFVDVINGTDLTISDVGYEADGRDKIKVTNKTGVNDISIRTIVTERGSSCDFACSTQGTAACTKACSCDGEYNIKPIYHGLVKDEDEELYYAAITESSDSEFSDTFYKKNMIFPTNITELGSSVNCDIDEVPFIIDELETTTYKLSEEDLASKGGDGGETTPFLLKEKDANVNLRAYVDFGCDGIRCLNVRGSLTSAQIGSDLYDLNDSGLECNTCSVYNDVDTDIREYFCRRFSTFVPTTNGNTITDMNINYVRPGSTQGENYYEPYGDVSPNCDDRFRSKFGALIDDDGNQGTPFVIDNELNDGDDITTGDKCGYWSNGSTSTKKEIKYFYGMDASSHTKNNLKNFPFESSKLGVDRDEDSLIMVDDDEGISPFTTQTPYFFYFGLVPGKTALNKLVGKFFSDKINSETLEDVTEDTDNTDEPKAGEEKVSPEAIIGSCLKT